MSGPKVSVSLGHVRKGPSVTNGQKRPRSTFQDEDEDVDAHGRSETVSHFDKAAGGAVDKSKPKPKDEPLVIPKLANRDWKEAANKRKRQRHGLPSPDPENNVQQLVAEAEAAKPKFGLNVVERPRADQEQQQTQMDNAQSREVLPTADRETTSQIGSAVRPPTDDQRAMDALLGKMTTDANLVIPQSIMSESDAFRHDYAEAPDMASLESYTSMPVEQFGAAMLRGMGWKDGEGIGSQKGVKLIKERDKLPERRAALLGIGAKEDAALSQEIGAWGRAARSGKGEVKIYNPVLLRDKKTGDLFTEEELKRKKERDERERYEMEFEQKEKEREARRQRSAEDDTRDERRKHRERRDKYGDRNHERDRDQRRRDGSSDEEYYRRKERERHRRDKDREDRHDRNYDRERSTRHRDYENHDERRRKKDRAQRERESKR